jgi:hypothetical protein
MDRVNLTGKVVTGIMELIGMTSVMAMVRCIGPMARCMMVCGSLEPSMGLENSIYQMVRKKREFLKIMFT